MIKFNLMAYLIDNELSLQDLADKIGIQRHTLWHIRKRSTAKPSFIKRLRKYKSVYPIDVYISGAKQ